MWIDFLRDTLHSNLEALNPGPKVTPLRCLNTIIEVSYELLLLILQQSANIVWPLMFVTMLNAISYLGLPFCNHQTLNYTWHYTQHAQWAKKKGRSRGKEQNVPKSQLIASCGFPKFDEFSSRSRPLWW